MGVFFTVIFFIIFGFYILGFILKLVFRVFIARKMKNFDPNKGFGGFNNSNRTAGGSDFGGNRQNYNDTNKEREGDVKITSTGGEDRRLKDKVGEYVDFDEVK